MTIEVSRRLFERAKLVTPGGVHSPVRAFRNVHTTPRFIERADGVYLYDVDGNRYVDYCMSWGPLLLGHGDPDVKEAVNKAVARGWSYGAVEPYSLELAEFLTRELPWVEKIRFVNSGTEAVMSALRVARAATGRNKLLKFDGCYHGHVDAMLVRAGSGLAEMANPDSAGVSKETAAQTLVAPLDDLAALQEIFATHGSDLAAVIIEPVPANNGLLLQRTNFLQELSALANKHGTLVIFDEVITGFRVAFGGVAELSGLKPDLVTYGKVIGGGFPVGAFGGRRDLMDLVAPQGPVYQAGTLSANPVAMSAGLATLQKLKRLNPYKALAAATESLGNDVMRSAATVCDTPVSLQSVASIFWMALGRPQGGDGIVRRADQISAEQKSMYATLYPLLLDKGYYLAPSGFEVGFVSTVHTQAHHEGLVEAIKTSLQAMSKG